MTFPIGGTILSLFVCAAVVSIADCSNTNKTKGKEKVSVLLQSAVLFYNAAKNVEDKLNSLQQYKPYEKGLLAMKNFGERLSAICSGMEELKKRVDENPNSSYVVEVHELLAKIDKENEDLITITKDLENPEKYNDNNEIVQQIKDERVLLTDLLKSFDLTAKEFMNNVDALEVNEIFLYTTKESDIKFDFSVMEKLIEMYTQVEKYQEQVEPFGEKIPTELNRVRNSMNILIQIEIPTFILKNRHMLENFVPSIIRSVEQTQEKYSHIDDLYDEMFAEYMNAVKENQLKAELFSKLSDDLASLSKTYYQKEVERNEL